ncbi:MAG: response regulator, partial [Candidatus Moranbacteria bacterium]|nr:response regulator [Candidatus Moranbacteria bacterium]
MDKKAYQKRILLAEDDIFVRDMYSVRLKKDGYEVKTVKDGRQALEWLSKNTPDIILLDIMMPFMDGLEVLTEIQKNENLNTIPVIMLTNLSEGDDIRKALTLGASDYIIKSHFT